VNRNTVLLGIIVLALVALGVFAYVTFSENGPDQPVAAVDTNTAPMIPAGYDNTLGNPNAPIKLIEYAAPMCPICAAFDMREFPKLKAEYIDTGKVFYTFRVFPIGNPDYPAEGIARCLPRAQYFPFIDMLYRNQDKWDPDGHEIADVPGALVKMAAVAGMPADKAQTCMMNKVTQDRTNQIAADAQTRYNVSGTPTFIVDGKPAFTGEWPWEQLKPALDARLKK
jgi:protein-disulfide isomerase